MYDWWSSSRQYSLLTADVDEDGSLTTELPRSQTLRGRWKARYATSLILQNLLIILVGCVGFILGILVSWEQKPPGSAMNTVPRVSIGQSVQVFSYNESFVAPPTTRGELEPIWDSLLPNGLGYVKNPLITANRSVISVFHQMHCLYTLRRAFYSTSASDLEDFDFGIDRMEHAAHCFEYLRQSLMCSADSTLEPAAVSSSAKNGLLGWGFRRQCHDYDALKDWAETWRAFDAHGFLAIDLKVPRSVSPRL